MKSTYFWILIYVAIIVAFETSAMSCFKKSIDDWRYFVLGVLFYVGVGGMLVKTLKLSGLAMTNALWSGLSVMATTTVGVLFFKENLHVHDFLAIALIGGGVIILKITH
jgi:multidrug transporter EmrE-like cation transporter